MTRIFATLSALAALLLLPLASAGISVAEDTSAVCAVVPSGGDALVLSGVGAAACPYAAVRCDVSGFETAGAAATSSRCSTAVVERPAVAACDAAVFSATSVGGCAVGVAVGGCEACDPCAVDPANCPAEIKVQVCVPVGSPVQMCRDFDCTWKDGCHATSDWYISIG